MEEKSAFDLIKPCSVSIQRLSVYHGESKSKKLYRKTVLASKKVKMVFLEKSNINNTSKDTQYGKLLKGNSGCTKYKKSIQKKKKENGPSQNLKNLKSYDIYQGANQTNH